MKYDAGERQGTRHSTHQTYLFASPALRGEAPPRPAPPAREQARVPAGPGRCWAGGFMAKGLPLRAHAGPLGPHRGEDRGVGVGGGVANPCRLPSSSRPCSHLSERSRPRPRKRPSIQITQKKNQLRPPKSAFMVETSVRPPEALSSYFLITDKTVRSDQH